jgi:RNase P subunit RPR2
MIPIPTKFPIFILSSARVGSNILSSYYRKNHGLVAFLDPDSTADGIQKVIDYRKISNRYVVKIHALHARDYPEELMRDLIEEDNFKIRVRRRDRAAQIASCYLANLRKRWYYTERMKNDQLLKSIPIDYGRIESEIRLIDDYYRAYDDYELNFDADLWYEDLGIIQETELIQTVLPNNYEELLLAIRKRIENGN